MNIHQSFEGKSIFFTGVTGFVGKVFLFKLLKEFPNMRSIFCLVRTKKNQAPLARFQKEVLSSQCFDPLKAQLGEDEFKRRLSKVVPLSGDMMEENLGLNDADYARLVNECNFIVHMAATVNFQEKLNISVQMNVLGVLRVLALARKCVQLEAMVHTSTCYVNWNRDSGEVAVLEKVYELPFDAEDMCKRILALHDAHIPEETEQLLTKHKFPNTYTFTKNMAEQILHKQKGKLPLSIVRPAIIGCAWREPMPGWIDVLTAAGAIILTAGLGILRDLNAERDYLADIVPVDFVINTLLKTVYKTALCHKRAYHVETPSKPLLITESAEAATQLVSTSVASKALGFGAADNSFSNAVVAHTGSSSVVPTATLRGSDSVGSSAVTEGGPNVIMPFVFASGTSGSKNPLRWRMLIDPIMDLWKEVPHPKAVGKVDCEMIRNRYEYLARLYLYRKLPFMMINVVAHLPPPLGNEDRKKMLGRYQKALYRTEMLNFQFNPFTTKQWIYDIAHSSFLDEGLDAPTMAAFGTDVFDIQWYTYFQLYSWGITKFVMKSANREQPRMPVTATQQFLKANL